MDILSAEFPGPSAVKRELGGIVEVGGTRNGA
jgi:hypothetical protein